MVFQEAEELKYERVTSLFTLPLFVNIKECKDASNVAGTSNKVCFVGPIFIGVPFKAILSSEY
jgi:hypothetical protein